MEDPKKIFERVYNKYAEGIVRFVYFKVSDYELAKDITVDVFTKFWKILLQGKIVKNEKALLYLIATGIVIDYYRRKTYKKNVRIEELDERFLITEDPIEENISKKQDLKRIYKQLKKLKEEYQEILFLHYIEDLSIAEINYVLHKSENALRVLLYRALKALKERL